MKLSIIYSVRDPRYGGGLVHRMQVSLDTLAHAAAKHNLDYEVVVTEWNPPTDAPRLAELMDVPELARGRLRFIEVPGTIHQRLQTPQAIPFCEYIGKNAAIRRSRGDWILASTPDVILNEHLVRYLARARLTNNTFYRIDRCDVAAQVPLSMPWRRRMGFCDAAATCVQSQTGPIPVTGLSPVSLSSRFLGWLIPSRSAREQEDPVHTNASGDFLLMNREDWFALRGYTELCSHGHIDSIMCWTARSAGLKQVILMGKLRLYHQEHDRSAHASFPQTDLETWTRKYEDALAMGTPLILNDTTWGLALDDLPETVI